MTDDLAIKKHTAPLSAELDRQKEKCAALKAELVQARRDHRSGVAALRAQRSATSCKLVRVTDELAQARRDHQSEAAALRVERETHRWTLADLARVTAELAASEALCEATQTERAAEIERATKLSAEVERLKREREELRGRVVDLTGDVASLKASQCGPECGSALEMGVLVRENERLKAEAATAAARQREACAETLERAGRGTLLSTSECDAFAWRVRATPLVAPDSVVDKNSLAYRNGMEDGAFAQREADIRTRTAYTKAQRNGWTDESLDEDIRATPLVTAPPRVECAACAHLPGEQRGLSSCGCLADSKVKR